MPDERNIWRGMLGRCQDPRHPKFHRYGGRGIRVCPGWQDFDTFLAHMGRRPGPGWSIDRIDNDGHYCPGNCRWATREQQRRNRPDNRMVTYQGREITIAEAAELAGVVNPMTALLRLNRGWDVERAVTEKPATNAQARNRALAERRRRIAERL